MKYEVLLNSLSSTGKGTNFIFKPVLQSFRRRLFSYDWQYPPNACPTFWGPGTYGKCCRRSPFHRYTRKRWRTGIASQMPDDTHRGLSRRVLACDKLTEYRHPHSRETLLLSQTFEFHTSDMHHRRLVEPPARLLIQRP